MTVSKRLAAWSRALRGLAAPGLVALFPFVFNLRLVYPNSALLVLQNDFGYLYHVYKAYLVDLIAHGHFPLWSPGEAGGYGFFSNPFAAVLYPFNVLPLAARLAFGNYNYWFHQIYTVLGVSWLALGVYRWLYQTSRRKVAACFAAILVSTSWSVGLFMRFPNAIHTLAWMPWVLVALHATHRRAARLPVFAGMFAVVCEITAGYPYFVVYSFFVYGGYALYLHWRTGPTGWRARALRQVSLIAVPVLLTAPYTSAVSELMAITTDRGGGNFAYATVFDFGPVDFIGSLVYPPVVTVEGCFYSSILGVFLIVLYLYKGRDTKEKLAWLAGVCGILAMTMGHRSYVFTPLWSFLPVVNQMRVFSRMTIILLPLLAVAIQRGFLIFERYWRDRRRLSTSFVLWVFGAILVSQVFLQRLDPSLKYEYNVHVAPRLPSGSTELDFIMYGVLSLLVVLVVLKVRWRAVRHGPAWAVGLLLFVATMDTGSQGRFLWTQTLSAALGNPPPEQLLSMGWERAKKEGDLYPLVRDYFKLARTSDEARLTSHGLTKKPMPNFYFDTYVTFYQSVQAKPALLNRLMGKQKLFFHRRPHGDAPSFLTDVDSHAKAMRNVHVESYDGDELIVHLKTLKPGYLTWIDNFSPGWSVEVDGQPRTLEKSLGTFKSVRLANAGEHRVRFRYRVPMSALSLVALAVGLLWLAAYWLWDFWLRRKRGEGSVGRSVKQRAHVGE